jgi:hypothetical protein
MLAHWGSLRKVEKERHFIKYDGELYSGDDVDRLPNGLDGTQDK